MPLNDVCLPAGSESEILTSLAVKPLYSVKSNLEWFMVLVGDRCSMLCYVCVCQEKLAKLD